MIVLKAPVFYMMWIHSDDSTLCYKAEGKMARGNQRDVDRARAQARATKNAKTSASKGDPNARREADAKALQEKIAKKAAMKAEGGSQQAPPAKKNNTNHRGDDEAKGAKPQTRSDAAAGRTQCDFQSSVVGHMPLTFLPWFP
ncbi:putative serf-like protein-like protein, partial [Globisporangium splendens]